jgi:aminoglycoside 6'-N-acetyltransferase
VTVTFRPLARDDFGLLGTWLGRAHVERWWQHDPSPTAVEDDFGDGVDGDDPIEYFVIVLDGRDVGLIQRYRYGDEDEWMSVMGVIGDLHPDTVGIDYLIGDEELTGRGIGTAVIAAFVADTWRRFPVAPAIVVDVDPSNRPSWRVLERNGFERIWSGDLDAPDPRDAGPCVVYRLRRP